MIRLLDIPCASQLQARLELCPASSAQSDGRTRDLLRAVVEVMGFSLDWTGYIDWPEPLPGEEPIDLDAYDDGEAEEGRVAFWRRRGWDIAGPNGRAVLFFDMVRAAVIVVDGGLAGRSKTGVEAALWKRQRDADRPSDQRQRRHDQAFLNFGKRSRRGS